ncbi:MULTISPECIES: CarD family transcriptional regulator [Lysinibacillus]|nr:MULTISPECIES: CarD family transcriptional regulator [Lysinibacillus]AHN23041.1 CarD family transcriptional regulator [Lysinibacillus varians]MCS1382823.1 CarD family transcriptional regulator [Lysinibacillus sphaericus]MED4546056.1 CarD family transcriptional regulator [Lysinibacillus sphaericus]UDK98137.1 CarD family transcriptional regulator [Lysinibacillus sphaericus]SUV18528.1 CarD family transcriptional regulator [Lysinibacillus sphaericus]
MYNVGDVVIYSSHGLCSVEDICEQTFSDITKTYYVLQPLNDSKLTIRTPIDNAKKQLRDVIQKEEAIRILQSFTSPGVEWIEQNTHRMRFHVEIIKTGDRQKQANLLNTLLRKKIEYEANEKKFPNQEEKLLHSLQEIIFSEFSIALDKPSEEIYDYVVAKLS